MATVCVDHMESGGFRYVEQSGVAQSLERSFLVKGLDTGTDWQLAVAAINALQEAGFTYGSAPEGEPGLALMAHEVESIDKMKTAVRGKLRYQAIGQEDDFFRFTVSASVQQTQTQNDRWGFPLEVVHEYPIDDPDFAGEIISQICEASILEPQLRLSAVGILTRSIPLFESVRWIGTVNATAWAGGAPGTWMCLRADAAPVHLGIVDGKWRFHFEFLYKLSGWNPTVYFKDRRDGLPPVDLVPGYGVYVADCYRPFEYRLLFP